MTLNKITAAAVIATMAMVGATSVVADTKIQSISKSTQGVPPVPPGLTAIFGPNIALVAGTIGIPGIILGTIVIAGVVYSIVQTSSSSTT